MSGTFQAATANRLSDGAVVYLAADGSWARGLDRAALAADTAAGDRLLAEATAAAAGAVVVNPYLIAVTLGSTGPSPVSLRERIRAGGPSESVVAAIPTP
jgi:hypothetical protein